MSPSRSSGPELSRRKDETLMANNDAQVTDWECAGGGWYPRTRNQALLPSRQRGIPQRRLMKWPAPHCQSTVLL